MEIEASATDRILTFLERIGIPVTLEELADGMVVPGIAIRDGGLVVDRARLTWPGDLLHEAGHIATTDPAERPTLSEVRDDLGEELATIAWSWAAALAAGVDPALVFHSGGYRGSSQAYLDNFATGHFVGVPLLQWYGMTHEPKPARASGVEPFPHMQRWLRQPRPAGENDEPAELPRMVPISG